MQLPAQFDSAALAAHGLLALIMFGTAYVLMRRPPAAINWLYGYRTHRSMRNPDTWQAGNAYSANLLLRLTLLLPVVQVLAYAILGPKTSLGVAIGYVVMEAVLVLIMTERYLAGHFDEAGNRRS